VSIGGSFGSGIGFGSGCGFFSGSGFGFGFGFVFGSSLDSTNIRLLFIIKASFMNQGSIVLFLSTNVSSQG
jgi:hypothetical protein